MDISDWRKRIDRLDARLVRLLNERARTSAIIARLKRKKKLPLYHPKREREILSRVQRLSRGPLSDAALKRLFRRVLVEARAVARQAGRRRKR